MTEWKWRLFLFLPVAANTATNRQAFAAVFVNNGSGETQANEEKMYDTVARLSLTGSNPADAFAINTAVKGMMRDDLKTLIDGIAQAQWYVVAAIDLPSWNEGELMQSSRAAVDPLIGTPFTFADALSDLGLQQIETEPVE